MDGLRERMKAEFWNDQKFGLPTPSFSVIEAYKSQEPLTQTTTTCRSLSVIARDLLQWLNTQPAVPAADAWRFQLVRIDQIQDESLRIDKATFETLCRLFRIDETALYMFSRQIVGVYHFKVDSTTPGGEPITSSFLNSVSGTVFWSHDKGLKQTRAIFIPRPWGNSVEGSIEMFHQLERTIGHQKSLIELHCFLQLVSVINLTAWFDTVIESELRQIRRVESSTGYGTWANRNDLPPPKELVNLSRDMGESASALANALRHADLIADFLAVEELRQSPTGGLQGGAQAPEVKAQELADHLRARVAMRKRDVEYLQQRVNNQLTVIFSLITKQQTDASLDLASAAKGDSEAMKVIAIMTMLFLPGTFFATCFAVPTLHWDDQNVISDRFWVYIAFSVPSTVLICMFYVGWPTLFQCLTTWPKRKSSARKE